MEELQRQALDQNDLSGSAQHTVDMLNEAGISGAENHDFNQFSPRLLKKFRKAARTKMRAALCAKSVSSKA